MYLPIGKLLQGGKYEIISYVGSGGFGCTYKARHAMLNTTVAIKEFFVKDYCNRDASTYRISVATQSKAELIERLRKKFIEEAQAIFNMNHPNIVRVTDIFEENGTVYYVMDYIEGCSLASLIADKGRLCEKEALGYIFQVADALDCVHNCNRLHLDVKPQNVMIDKNGKAVLIDFGVSKQYDEVGGENTSTLLGCTPGYAPIEQSGNGVVRFYPSADIYALGATLYKALTGVTPVAAHLRASGEELDPLPADISPATRIAVEAAMEIAKMHRPQSVEEFLGKLKVQRAKSKAASFDNIGSDSSSTHRGEVSRSDGGETELSKVKTENGKLKTASFDDDETRVGINPPRPSDTPPFEKVGELSKADSNNEETSINSSSTHRGEVSRSDGGETELSKVKTENGNVKTEKRKSNLLWVIIALLLSAIIGVCGYLLFSGSGDENISWDDTPEKEQETPTSAAQVLEDELPVANDAFSTREFTVKGVKFKMVAVKGGKFQMGSNDGEDDEKPVHNVTLSDYYIGETEVTQELWQAVMGSNPSYFTGNDQRPVECVSWDDCQTFVNKLNNLLAGQLPAGRKFRLPTEAEWEYAARGGNRSRRTQYSGSDTLAEVAWYDEDWDTGSTHRVKLKKANELGLYDMSGNVWEWCFDSYASYTNRSQTNPKVNNGGDSYRVLRGGGWAYHAQGCRVAYRGDYNPVNRSGNGGLRLAL